MMERIKKGKENRTSTNSIKVVLTNSCYNFGFFFFVILYRHSQAVAMDGWEKYFFYVAISSLFYPSISSSSFYFCV